jgi:2-desacetyl-2-hydroxyethyl bacteriochlorophyllide A dehydrogenase
VNRAVVFEGPHEIRLVTREIPDVGPGEAMIKIEWAGICGSDVDLRKGTRPSANVRYPVVPGHEWSGVVEAIGEGVDPHWLHKPVVGENIRSCGTCPRCREGKVAICERTYSEAGFTLDGAWADRLLMPATQLHALPGDADLRSAAGIEPAACAATSVAQAHLEPHHRVGVVGGGTIGLLCTQLLSSRGIDVTVIDPRSWKRPLAIDCGASRLVDPERARSGIEDLDVVIEAAGVTGSVQMAIDLARRGGRVVVCGIAPPHDAVRSVDIASKNLDVVGVFGATRSGWETAVVEFLAGNLDPGALVTHEFLLNEFESALNLVENSGPGVGKVLLRP